MINCANGENPEFGDELTKQLVEDLDLKRLGIQLAMFPAFIEDWDRKITFISPIDTVIECMKKRKLDKLLPDFHILLKLYLTVPLSTASTERTLSGLRRVKSYLRNTLALRLLNYFTRA